MLFTPKVATITILPLNNGSWNPNSQILILLLNQEKSFLRKMMHCYIVTNEDFIMSLWFESSVMSKVVCKNLHKFHCHMQYYACSFMHFYAWRTTYSLSRRDLIVLVHQIHYIQIIITYFFRYWHASTLIQSRKKTVFNLALDYFKSL